MHWRMSGRAAAFVLAAILCGCRGSSPSAGERALSAVRPGGAPRQSEPSAAPPRQAEPTDEGPRQAAAEIEDDAPAPVSAASGWARWWGPFAKPGRIPLPRTDLHLDDEFDDEPAPAALDEF